MLSDQALQVSMLFVHESMDDSTLLLVLRGHTRPAQPDKPSICALTTFSCFFVCMHARRQRTVRARADASNSAQGGHHGDGTDEPLYLPATASTYCPFSAELLLATTRLGHLERYREEVQQLYELGMPVDLTRVALLISNIYQPQLDHRTYFDALEHLVAAATLGVMRKVSALAAGAQAGDESCSYFNGLDLHNPQHVLCAVHAINELMFEDEGLGVDAADPYDPLNGSLADLLDSRKGELQGCNQHRTDSHRHAR